MDYIALDVETPNSKNDSICSIAVELLTDENRRHRRKRPNNSDSYTDDSSVTNDPTQYVYIIDPSDPYHRRPKRVPRKRARPDDVITVDFETVPDPSDPSVRRRKRVPKPKDN